MNNKINFILKNLMMQLLILKINLHKMKKIKKMLIKNKEDHFHKYFQKFKKINLILRIKF